MLAPFRQQADRLALAQGGQPVGQSQNKRDIDQTEDDNDIGDDFKSFQGCICILTVVPIPTDLAAFQAGKKFFQVVSGHILQGQVKLGADLGQVPQHVT